MQLKEDTRTYVCIRPRRSIGLCTHTTSLTCVLLLTHLYAFERADLWVYAHIHFKEEIHAHVHV